MATPNKSLARRVIPVGLVLAVCIWLAVARNTYWIPRHPRPQPKPELLPVETTAPAWDGSYPVLAITLEVPSSGHIKYAAAIVMRQPTVQHSAPANEFDVALDSGLFVLRQTDLFVPDAMPLVLTRIYRPWDYRDHAFGVGANHPYDICPTGTRNPYTYINLNLEDGRQIYFPRISKGMSYSDAVFRHRDTSSEFYGAEIAWNGDGWTLEFSDHRKFLFPEAYSAKNYAQGAPTEMQDGHGNRIQLKRDKARNLSELISPSGHTITFQYDGADRIKEARDDAGNIRTYLYDSSGHLESVSDQSHVLYRFEYARTLSRRGYDPYVMTVVMDGSWETLLKNTYNRYGEVSQQRLGDGRVWRYDYSHDSKNQIVETTVTFQDGHKRQLRFRDGSLAGP